MCTVAFQLANFVNKGPLGIASTQVRRELIARPFSRDHTFLGTQSSPPMLRARGG